MALMYDQWFNPTVSIMTSEEMSEFCERLAVFMVDDGCPISFTRKRFLRPLWIAVFAGMEKSYSHQALESTCPLNYG